jgi:hypothetical protein
MSEGQGTPAKKLRIDRHYGVILFPNWIPERNAQVVLVRSSSKRDGRWNKVESVKAASDVISFATAKQVCTELNDAAEDARKAKSRARAAAAAAKLARAPRRKRSRYTQPMDAGCGMSGIQMGN